VHRRCHHGRRRPRSGARSDCGESGLTCSVSLLVPGLAADFTGSPAGGLPAAPALSLWLRRAVASPFAATWTEQAIATLCGIAFTDTPPVAALTYLEDFGELPSGYCLRADPVHLRADTSGLVLFDSAAFALTDAESRALSSTLTAYLAEAGWTLRHRHPCRWYLLGEQAQDLRAAPLPLARAAPVSATPFRGVDAPTWMTRLNELQMLMHTHPVNRARAATGQVAVNSLWLWGGGAPQRGADGAVKRVVADNPFARGSARYQCIPLSPLQAGAVPATAALATGERLLVVLEACRDAAAYEDIRAWQAGVQRLEDDWFAALVQSLKTGRLDSLELYPMNGRCYRLSRRQLLAFWKGRGDYRSERKFGDPAAKRV
jgi:hypothetical protein